MPLSLFSFFLLAFTWNLTARTITLGLEDAGPYALEHQPALAAARLRIDEARGQLQQAGRLPNPELSGGFLQNVRTPERSGELALTQRFPLTARLRLEKMLSRSELLAAEAEVREAERKASGEVRASIIRLLAVNAQRALGQMQLANAREAAGAASQRLSRGESSQTDVTLLELEVSQAESELGQLEVERSRWLGELRPQLGLAPSDELRLRGTLLEVTAPAGRRLDLDERPDLRAARATSLAAQGAAALARAQRWGDLSVGLAVQSQAEEDAPQGIERDELVGVRFSLPLPLWDDNAGRVHEAEATAHRRALEVDTLAAGIRAEAESAQREMAALAKVLTSMGAVLLPQARQVEEQLRAASALGEVPRSELQRARERRLSLERQRLETLRDYHLARLRYETATPRPASSSTLRSR